MGFWCVDHCLYQYSKSPKSFVLLAVYVDDVILTASDDNILQETKDLLMYKMSDLGELIRCLEIDVLYNDRSVPIF